MGFRGHDEQIDALKCRQHAFGSGFGCATFPVAGIDASQRRSLCSQSLPGQIIAQGQQARTQGQEVKKTLRMIVSPHVDRRDRKKLALQTTEDVLLDVLVSVGQDSLAEGKALLGRIGGIDAPASLKLGRFDRFQVASDGQVKAHLALHHLLQGQCDDIRQRDIQFQNRNASEPAAYSRLRNPTPITRNSAQVN